MAVPAVFFEQRLYLLFEEFDAIDFLSVGVRKEGRNKKDGKTPAGPQEFASSRNPNPKRKRGAPRYLAYASGWDWLHRSP